MGFRTTAPLAETAMRVQRAMSVSCMTVVKSVGQGKDVEENGTRPEEDVKGRKIVSRTAAEELAVCISRLL